MNRLTTPNSHYCDDCGYKPSEFCACNIEIAMYEKLKQYEDAEEQGQLVMLPCKVGDTVYFLQRCLDSYTFVNCGDIIAFHVYSSYITVEVNDHDAFNPFVTLDVSAFGKTVFLTREEAEAALNGGQRE